MGMKFLLFTVDSASYGIAAEAVGEMVRAVAVAPLPGAPAAIAGIIDVRGSIVPVFDMRVRLGASHRAVSPDDHFILVHATGRTAALHVDTVVELVEIDPAAIATASAQLPPTPLIAGVALLPSGLTLIHDVDSFLSTAESETLETALTASAARS
ncbi:MAG: chemotaxis protein CheW [Gemmatimonadales bacterium]